jgi:hypothetical protein
VSSVILVRQNSFNEAVLLRGQAYGVALFAREVQQNAVSAQGNVGDFRSLHGLHFNLANPNAYAIFIDADNDGFYDMAERFGKQGTVDKKFVVTGLRYMQGGTPNPVTELSVVFERPNFDARFFTAPNTEQTNATSIEIDISTQDLSLTRTVEITATGQITVQ